MLLHAKMLTLDLHETCYVSKMSLFDYKVTQMYTMIPSIKDETWLNGEWPYTQVNIPALNVNLYDVRSIENPHYGNIYYGVNGPMLDANPFIVFRHKGDFLHFIQLKDKEIVFKAFTLLTDKFTNKNIKIVGNAQDIIKKCESRISAQKKEYILSDIAIIVAFISILALILLFLSYLRELINKRRIDRIIEEEKLREEVRKSMRDNTD